MVHLWKDGGRDRDVKIERQPWQNHGKFVNTLATLVEEDRQSGWFSKGVRGKAMCLPISGASQQGMTRCWEAI